MNSYKWFVEKGLKDLFREVSPVRDYSGKDLALYFVDYYFDEPKHDEQSKRNAFMKRLCERNCVWKIKTGEIKEQEIYMGDFR